MASAGGYNPGFSPVYSHSQITFLQSSNYGLAATSKRPHSLLLTN